MLQLLVRGLAMKEIAALLTVSLEEARAHVQSILVKLGVHSRLEAAAFTIRPDPPPPLPPAPSAALAVPFQWAEDVPRHVGKRLFEGASSRSTSGNGSGFFSPTRGVCARAGPALHAPASCPSSRSASVVELEEKRVAVELEVVGCDDMEGQKRSVVKVNPLRFQR